MQVWPVAITVFAEVVGAGRSVPALVARAPAQSAQWRTAAPLAGDLSRKFCDA
jgi:hypothetical protein